MTGVTAAVSGLVDGAQALAQLALFNDDDNRFRESVVANLPAIDGFLAQARLQAEAMYSEARTYRRDRILAGAGAAKTQTELDAFKVAAASWILMIDETRRNLAFLTEAIKEDRGGTSFPQVAASTERIAEFTVQMESAQQIFGLSRKTFRSTLTHFSWKRTLFWMPLSLQVVARKMHCATNWSPSKVLSKRYSAN